ncbi:hypothetical protein KIW84_034914 [Lathyrus oleraceus]|uniref:Uncharacterized protein n=1 Tax=Pisum sativum TaxID=3888 RepID=A0A9D5B5W6_PEA|nr:hypothetical protein KIW84_034914 [Pisum sativum]
MLRGCRKKCDYYLLKTRLGAVMIAVRRTGVPFSGTTVGFDGVHHLYVLHEMLWIFAWDALPEPHRLPCGFHCRFPCCFGHCNLYTKDRKIVHWWWLNHGSELEMGLDNEVATLEKQKKLLEKIPGMELNEEPKKLRQACFKSNYKKRRLITFHH